MNISACVEARDERSSVGTIEAPESKLLLATSGAAESIRVNKSKFRRGNMTRALLHRATIITLLLASVPIMTRGSVWHSRLVTRE